MILDFFISFNIINFIYNYFKKRKFLREIQIQSRQIQQF
jgi:hypothetical protein